MMEAPITNLHVILEAYQVPVAAISLCLLSASFCIFLVLCCLWHGAFTKPTLFNH